MPPYLVLFGPVHGIIHAWLRKEKAHEGKQESMNGKIIIKVKTV